MIINMKLTFNMKKFSCLQMENSSAETKHIKSQRINFVGKDEITERKANQAIKATKVCILAHCQILLP